MQDMSGPWGSDFCYWFMEFMGFMGLMGWLLRSHNDGSVKTTETDPAQPIPHCSWGMLNTPGQLKATHIWKFALARGTQASPLFVQQAACSPLAFYFSSKYSGEGLKDFGKAQFALRDTALSVGSEGSCWVFYVFFTYSTQCKQATIWTIPGQVTTQEMLQRAFHLEFWTQIRVWRSSG